MTERSLCKACREESDAWLEYRPRVLGLTIHEKASRDTTKQGVRDRNAAKLSEWRNTVRFQQGLIAKACAAEQHALRERTAPDILSDWLILRYPFLCGVVSLAVVVAVIYLAFQA